MTPLQIIVSFPEGIQRNVNKKPIEIFVFQVIWIDGQDASEKGWDRPGSLNKYSIQSVFNNSCHQTLLLCQQWEN